MTLILEQFSFDGTPYDRKDPNSQTYIRASDARQQQAGVPDGTARPYPSHFGNAEGLPLTTPGFDNGDGYGKQYLHHPLTPGRQDTWAPGTGVPRGGVRSVYTTGNKTDFNVVYHDPKKGTTARGHSQFNMANYHPGVKRAPTF